eukprot:1180549-Prorocentrum_minimum.AAC.4
MLPISSTQTTYHSRSIMKTYLDRNQCLQTSGHIDLANEVVIGRCNRCSACTSNVQAIVGGQPRFRV